MTIVSGKNIINKARQNSYAIGAFNTNNLEWTEAILRVAQAQQAPTIIAASMGAVKYMGGFKTVVDLIHDLHDDLNITVPIAIHLDHGDFEAAKAAIAAGFTSVMFDGSSLPIDENLAKTQEIVNLAHAKGISVEAEVGSIGGEEDGIIGGGEIAPIPDAVAMVNTGIDFLAAGIGNIHGPYPDNWKGLHLDHLKNITLAVNEAIGHEMPIVLHGGSGIPDDQIKTAISMGVSKVNVNSEAQLAFHEALREFILADHDLEGKNYDPRKLLATGVKGIESALTERIDVFGNANKA
ncbi:class II fructose-bisphosphate aldolase [Weissella sagaensis]|uniref:Class II fructose-bisphosphate aldolase n=1 Tax=Weissella sagaensis TaxID=2559928 RepID=A0ABW1RSF4_9LACO|nr:class II fructose-bisphosphate aldolase [Weissella sagaensis]KAA8433956.1 fructose-bisphosphate aldolase [Weissella paramesenteroides]MBU7568132.1 fructose-bisphosphate aldolase [Weissella hellenica]KAA8438274.1 fructose-bisphosphate aldolase [Weissella paramesenteroides]QDJ58193.1 fructose-bisphosphate aldolase [Weissella hellenica]QEA57187.1 fructose-bisphosphate aldolase [Weissella hellenica]